MIIKRMVSYRMSVPLTVPYHLSFGPLKQLESLWVMVEVDGAGEGWGECTPLPGYSDTTIQAVERETANLASRWVGQDAGEILEGFHPDSDGFLFTAPLTALEEALGVIPRNLAGRVPLVGLVQEGRGEAVADAIARVRSLGYGTFKFKVGLHEADEEALRLTRIQDALKPGERIRIDANQGLNFEQALRIGAACRPDKVELFEQPFPVEAWKEMAELRRRIAPVCLMLDESITDEKTLEKAHDLAAADYVKLKWMKQGGWRRLGAMADRAEDLGFKVVFGNGVAGYLNNYHEAAFWLSRLATSGVCSESNGFSKFTGNCDGMIAFDDGAAIVRPREPGTLQRLMLRYGACVHARFEV